MRRLKCLVLIHVYYPDLWAEIAARLQALDGVEFDLLVNAVEGQTPPEWAGTVKATFPQARVFVSPNRGQDVGGTLSVLRRADLDRYGLVCKVHTKKCPHDPALGARWRADLLGACLGDPGRVFDLFAQDSAVSMVGSRHWVLDARDGNLENCLHLCDRVGVDRRWAGGVYVAGTMFWCRPWVLRRFIDAGLRQDEFPYGYAGDGTLAHAAERVFGAVARSGGRLVGV